MVFQEETQTSWFWPLSPLHSKKEPEFHLDDSDDAEKWDRERAFEIADDIEKGLARELATEFIQPLRRSSRLWRFHVVRSEDKLHHRLFSDEGDFLMYARTNLEERKICFFLYNPQDREQRLYDPSRPAFTMTFNQSRTEWRIVQEKCDNCRFSPKHMSCAVAGKQQVAVIKHSKVPVGDGLFNCMEVQVPGVYPDGSPVVWCPTLGFGDLGDEYDACTEVQVFKTKVPIWSEQVESLVLDFKDRNIQSSAKNFQLSMPLSSRPKSVYCQYGKIGTNTFGLDFRHPLSVIQAFGMSLSTLFWM